MMAGDSGQRGGDNNLRWPRWATRRRRRRRAVATTACASHDGRCGGILELGEAVVAVEGIEGPGELRLVDGDGWR